MNQYYVGDDISMEVPLSANGMLNMDLSGATITAGIVSPSGVIAAGTSPFSIIPPSSRTGKVIIELAGAITRLLLPGIYAIEINTVEGGFRTTYDRYPFRILAAALSGDIPPPTPSTSQFDFNNPDNAGMLAILF